MTPPDGEAFTTKEILVEVWQELRELRRSVEQKFEDIEEKIPVHLPERLVALEKDLSERQGFHVGGVAAWAAIIAALAAVSTLVALAEHIVGG